MRDPLDQTLSVAGKERREAILLAALRQAALRRRRRTLMQVGAALCAVLMLAAMFRERATMPQVVVKPPPMTLPAVPNTQAPSARVAITWVKTDSDLLSQLALPQQKPTWDVLSDDELLRSLTDAGKPAALARMDGRATLLFRTGLR